MNATAKYILLSLILPFLVVLAFVISYHLFKFKVPGLFSLMWPTTKFPIMWLEFIPTFLLLVFFPQFPTWAKLTWSGIVFVLLQMPVLLAHMIFSCALFRACL